MDEYHTRKLFALLRQSQCDRRGKKGEHFGLLFFVIFSCVGQRVDRLILTQPRHGGHPRFLIIPFSPTDPLGRGMMKGGENRKEEKQSHAWMKRTMQIISKCNFSTESTPSPIEGQSTAESEARKQVLKLHILCMFKPSDSHCPVC